MHRGNTLSSLRSGNAFYDPLVDQDKLLLTTDIYNLKLYDLLLSNLEDVLQLFE